MTRAWMNLRILVLPAGVVGCSGSAIVDAKDPTFARAQAQMQCSAHAVDDAEVTPAERAVFIQAQSFYRYRFEPPAPGVEALAAESAAAITDFPAFEAVAGSLDLLELRLRAPDAAAQLWEVLLARYPPSVLATLQTTLVVNAIGASGRFTGTRLPARVRLRPTAAPHSR